MIDWQGIVYIFASGMMLTMSVLGLESAVDTPSLSRWDKRFFASFFSALSLCSAAFFLELAAYVNPELIALQAVAYFIQSLFGTIAFPLLAVYLLHCCGEDWRSSTLTRIVFALWAVLFVLLVIAQITDMFWQWDSSGQPHLGPAYNLLVAPVLAMQLIILAGIVRRRGKLAPQRYRALLICLVPVTIAIVFHMFIAPSFTLINVSLVLSVYSAYRIIVSDSVEQSLHQQRQIASQSAASRCCRCGRTSSTTP